MKYKFRAECNQDIEQFLNALPKNEILSHQTFPDLNGRPDVETIIDFASFNIDKIRDFMRLIPDGHIMVQTVALEKDYTGIRNYNL